MYYLESWGYCSRLRYLDYKIDTEKYNQVDSYLFYQYFKIYSTLDNLSRSIQL